MATTDRDFTPTEGENNNEDLNAMNDQNNQDQDQESNKNQKSARRIDDATNTSGYGSSQRTREDNVGPLQSDLAQLPSQKRRDRGSLTGSGLD